MRSLMKQLLFLFLGHLVVSYHVSCPSHLFLRSQSVDSARELAGWAHQINLFDVETFYGSFAITPEYTRSFNNKHIAQCLFGNSINNSSSKDCATFNVTGSCVSNRNSCDLLADYFGLPTDFSSTITVAPRIENFLVDFDLYVGLDEWLCGLWFRVHAPIVHARWKLGFNEKINNSGVNAYPEGYFTPIAVPRSQLLPSFSAFLSGQAPVLNGGVVFHPLQHDLIPCISNNSNDGCLSFCESGIQKRTRLSDILAAFGLNFWQGKDFHFGLGIRGSAPTGTKLNDSCLLFYPIIGNGHHWEIGGMLTSHYTFWYSQDYYQSLGIYFDANITTLFDARQCRVFDICGAGDVSRYMLAQQMTPTILNGLRGNPTCITSGGVAPSSGYTTPSAQFNNLVTPVANIAFACVKSSVPVQADITIMLHYQKGCFEFDCGYNFWATDCEKVRLCSNNNVLQFNAWALKGDASLFGFDNETVPGSFLPVALSATQSEATVFAGDNGCPSTTAHFGNTFIDNGQCAYVNRTGVSGDEVPLFSNTSGTANTAANPQTHTSVNPTFLSDAHLNISGSGAQGMSHSFFTHISYSWNKDYCYTPYLGIGAKVEFASHDTSCVNDNKVTCMALNTNCCACNDNCSNCALSQWGIWLKGGISF